MPDREEIIEGLKKVWDAFNSMEHELYADYVFDALELLKEQDNEKKRIMKVIWDALHEGFSIDTIADQDWVYEQIRHRIEDT